MFYIKGKNKFFLSFFLILLQFILIYAQTTRTIEFPKNILIIPVNGEIISISESTNKIIKYENNNEQRTIGNYSEEILYHKEIVNLAENSFVIFGMDDNNNTCYQVFNYINSQLIPSELVTLDNIYIDDAKQYHIHCNPSNYCVFALTKSNLFSINKINLNTSTNQETKINKENMETSFIECDSIDFRTIFCIYGFIDGAQHKMGYNYIDYSSNDNICNGCLMGTVSKISIESNNSFLICYQQGTIKCQYYELNNNNIVQGKIYDVYTYILKSENTNYKLILKTFNYTIFLKITYYLDRNMEVPLSILFLMSINFKLKVTFPIKYLEKANNLFIDNDNYYDFYQNLSYNFLKINSFIEKKPNDVLYFSINGNTEYDFTTGHIGQNLYISLDPSTIFYHNDEKLNNDNQYNSIDIEEDDYFSFGKSDADITTNYYCYYLDGPTYDDDGWISPIGKIQIKRCEESCLECNFTLVGNNNNHYCTKCNNGYYPFYEITNANNKKNFNCYQTNSPEVSRAYLSRGVFYFCNETCSSCENANNCLTCADKHYFKVYKNDTPIYTDHCYNSTTPVQYYFVENANILNKNGVLIKSVYRPCYESCATCSVPGTVEQNNCEKCYDNFIKYKYSDIQCLLDTNICLNNHKYWILENNNITCIPTCDLSIISEGKNKGQCIENCRDYLNPFLEIGERDENFLTLTCKNLTYCILYTTCYDIGFRPSRDGLHCLGDCDDYLVMDYDNISHYINSLPIPVINITKPNMTEKLDIIKRRKKRIEIYKESKSYEEVIASFGEEIITNYNSLFRTQYPDVKNLGYLITSTTYDNFTISIYPLDIENYVYENLFYANNLGFVNFTKAYPKFLEYEVDTGELLLVCIMEYFSHSYSINDLNYFIYSYNEYDNTTSLRKLQNGNKLPNIDELYKNSKNYEILYTLHDYKNKNVSVNKRNSEYLVNNIRHIYNEYPEINLFDKEDPFYNDICFLFETDVGTDMTLNDRREEYYVNRFLCEDNCALLNIINRDSNPRSVCSCKKKPQIIFNDITKKESDIGTHSSPPALSIKCFTETLNIYLGRNPIFWIFMIIIIYQIYFLTMYLKYQNKILENMLGLKDNNVIQNNSEGISSSIYSKIIINNSSKNKESMGENSISVKGKSSSKEEKKSAPINVYNPPKKQNNNNLDSNKSNNMKTNDKDLISKTDSTIIKDLNNKNNFEGSDISYSDIKNGFDMVEINNLIDQDCIMENNFLKNPLHLEKIKTMKRIKRSMNPLKDEEKDKYCQTLEDILYSNENKHKFKNKKNKLIASNLGGEDIITNNLIDNLSEDDTKPRYPRNKIDPNVTSEKNRTIGSEHIIYQGNTEKNNNNVDRYNNINNKNNDDNLDFLFATKKSSLGSFMKSLGKKEVTTSLKNISDKILKTDEDLDMNNKIKKELIKIGKTQKMRPSSSYNKMNNSKYKKLRDTKYKYNIKNNKSPKREIINIKKKNQEKYQLNINKKIVEENDDSNAHLKNKSQEKELNVRIKPKKIVSIKLKNDDENHIINNINKLDLSDSNNKDIIILNKKEKISSGNKEVTDSKRIIKFQEETEIEGDKAINNELDLEKLKQKRTQNLELLNDQIVVSSVVEFLETESKELMIEDDFVLFYWKYFIRRELGFIVIRDKNKSVPYFVRYSCFGFCISFLFLLNCFFFVESFVHKRYINALDGVSINISYYFEKEFGTTCLVAFLGNIFKMIVIKLVLYRALKIGKTIKKLMSRSAEKGLTKDEIEQLNEKREKFMQDYRKYLIIYFSVLMGLTIFIGYICTCYGGVYKNSVNNFLFGILFSMIFSFIFCAAICFLIVGLYKIGKITNSKCAVSAYIVLSTLY